MSIDAEMQRHVPLVRQVAKTLSGCDVSLRSERGEALFSGGMRGLQRALERFDPAAGYAFSTYAWSWIRGAALREAKRVRAFRQAHELFASHAVVYGSQAIERDEAREEAQALMARLSPRLRRVVVALFFEGKTQADVALEMGLARQRITQLLQEALQVMRGESTKPRRKRAPAVHKAGNGAENGVKNEAGFAAVGA